ncbi:MAG: desulfoferrodoxin [Actinobacteria bacterium]|nr:desulfoferrodoxin [Actinomycetota bacterium]
MATRLAVYKCEICGNIVWVMHEGKGELVCCGQPMKLMEAGMIDAAVEKHVPVIEKSDGGVKVKVGSAPHPMEDAHYIEWIEVRTDDMSCHKFLKPGGTAEAEFPIDEEDLVSYEYCNIHGLWKGEK